MPQIQGQIVDIFSEKIFPGELEISNGIITAINEVDEAPEIYIIPGFIDAHIHIESSMLIPSEFARLAVCHGTVGTVSDPHEIGNVLGKEGVKFMIANGNKTPFKFYFGAPSCVPATNFETAGANITVEDIKELFALPRVNYLAEMMNFPGVLNADKEVMEKINLAKKLNKLIDGHAPGLIGDDAKKYAAAGITTDHECFTKEEALEKLAYGMKILIREGSAAKNFEALWELIDEFPESVMLCSDDKHPNDLVDGHINHLVARAVAKGCHLMNVLRAACINPVVHYKMDVGLLRLNDHADFCIVNNLEEFNVLATYIDGKCVSKEGASLIQTVFESPINNFQCSAIEPAQISIKDHGKKVKVITVEDGQLITGKTEVMLPSHNGELLSDLSQDILKMVVVNRYADAPPAVSFVKNFGLREGAIASSVAHDSHNIIAVGANDDDICEAVNLIIEAKGGVSISRKGDQNILELPVGGLMTNKDGYQVAKLYDEMDKKAKLLGSPLKSPFMTLSFCALLVIPSLKLSDKGLFDGQKFQFTSIYED